MNTSQPTLADIAQQLQELKTATTERFDKLTTEVKGIRQEIKEVKTAIEKLDSRFFELSMRIVSTNQSAFWSVSVAVLAAVIAFVVARVSTLQP